ncbi:MAG TPA: 2Fe-2S iron-sulfur cluster-binding protein [Candidatus Krumholzibacteria bacterium]|nr:2Fe-2S iron-sulfur cluster-binding protein [Candidatus Krumholzibacteria bacterium]
MSVNVVINGKKIQCADGALVIDVCRDNGIDIPHFCYHPGLGPDGNCRMCQVDFVGPRGNKLGISCKTTVAEGMEVLTDTDAAKRARASVEEMLLLNHPLDCPICDKAGECSLQNYYMEHDLQPGRQDFTRFRKEKAKDIGPTLILDQERCVLCDRCVRFLRDVAHDEQLYIAGRGHEAFITTFPGQEVTSPYSINTVDLCPVGALTSKDFRFNSATWFLQDTNSVCTTCARGCSMEIQTKKDQVYRMRPRENMQVNTYWACDEGRINYQFVNQDRIATPFIRRGVDTIECSLTEAIAEMRALLGYKPAGRVEQPSSRRVLVLASATCTLEELFLLKRLAQECLNAPVLVARHVPDGVDDHLLRRADKHPNARGAEMLGLRVVDLQRGGVSDVQNELGRDGVLLTVGFNTHVEAIAPLWSSAARVIALSGCKSALTEAADLVVPGRTFAEKDGIVVNFEGHAQQLRPAIDTKAETEWRVIDGLIASLTGAAPHASIAHVRKAVMDGTPAFAGVDLLKLGLTGARTTGQTVAR